MSALDNLLEEVRLEAEQAVRTEYENTVVTLRARVTELERDLDTANRDRELWRTAEHKIGQTHDDLLDALDSLVRSFR